ncbi:MAG TPA: hypothetical protein VFQ85_05270 [Mycobacteriales bacterium]|nr:hypothetical protein [Mycobacteriales bacterium]
MRRLLLAAVAVPLALSLAAPASASLRDECYNSTPFFVGGAVCRVFPDH